MSVFVHLAWREGFFYGIIRLWISRRHITWGVRAFSLFLGKRLKWPLLFLLIVVGLWTRRLFSSIPDVDRFRIEASIYGVGRIYDFYIAS